MTDFNYEWWTVEIAVENMGFDTWEFKGKSKDHIIKQIEKAIKDTNSEKNLQKGWLEGRKQRIREVRWETLKLDHIGYQRWG